MSDTWEDQTAHFQAIPWCAKVLSEPGLIVAPPVSRQFNPDNRTYEYWGVTLHSAATVPFFIGCYHLPPPPPPPGTGETEATQLPLEALFVTKARFFITLGHGLSTMKKDLVHGGMVASILDECMGAVGFINMLNGLMPRTQQVTQTLKITYVRPVPAMSTLACTAVLKRVDGQRKYEVVGEITDERGTVLASAEALFVAVAKRSTKEEKL